MRQKISKWIEREFEAGSEPDRRTVIAMIQRKELAGEKIGGQWFVITGKQETGNPIADDILKGIN